MSIEEADGVVWKKTENIVTSDSGADIWDDTALIKAYDIAVAQLRGDIPDASVDEKHSDSGKRRKKKKKKKSNNGSHGKKTWKVGSKCLAIYSYDGLYYEATILSINNDSAYVKFDFYENEEEVVLTKLLSVEMKTQLLSAEGRDGSEQEDYRKTEGSNKKTKKGKQKSHKWSISDICFAPNERNVYEQAVINYFVDATTCSVTFINGKKKKKVAIHLLQCTPQPSPFTWSSMPGPHLTPGRNIPASWASTSFTPPIQTPAFTSMMMPNQPFAPFANRLPEWQNLLHGRLNPTTAPPYSPPPPLIPSNIVHGDEEALANMLMSWYMSGYHTGYYQGMRDVNRGKNPTSSIPAFDPSRSSTQQDKSDAPTFDSNTST